MTDPRGLDFYVTNGREDRAIARTLSVGRHTRCDLIATGTGVQDQHATIVPDRRGPLIQPVSGAAVMINGRRHDRLVGVMPGDRLELGDALLEFVAVPSGTPEANAWHIYGVDGTPPVQLEGTLRIGREGVSDIQLRDLHASRRHAMLCLLAGAVWVRDLDSVNGTFINGERVRGARRVFHGDELRFDRYVCQLVGRGEDLTPFRAPVQQDRRPLEARGAALLPALGNETQQFELTEITLDNHDHGDMLEPGIYLVDTTQGGAGVWYRLRIGRTLIGREPDCDLRLRDLSVSGRHLEINVRPEGAVITDLISTNGTRVNGKRVRTAHLVDGNVIAVGRLQFSFREVRRRQRARHLFRWLRGRRD
jgi:pSer/pThr/pTyr-binding forkhead associated (FHA) protein